MSPEAIKLTDVMSRLKIEQSDPNTGITITPLTPQYLKSHYDILVAQWKKFFNNPETKKYLHPLTPYKVLADGTEVTIPIEEFMENNATSDNSVFYIIVHPESQIPIGHLRLTSIDPQTLSANRGMVIGEKAFRGRGISKIVSKMSITLARQAGLKELKASAKTDNLPSIANLTRDFGAGTLSGDRKESNFSLVL